MTKHTLAETSEWVAGNLRKAKGVSKVEVLSDQVLRVSRTKYDPFVAGIVSAKCVEMDTVRTLVKWQTLRGDHRQCAEGGPIRPAEPSG
jgi:hypothetical protein